jgi:cysteine desulfurase
MSILFLDHAATTPCRPEVWELMGKYALSEFGNPDSLYRLGRTARHAIEDAKQTIGDCLGCGGNEILITSGGTESDRIALLDTAYANRDRGNHLIVSSIEHLASLDICKRLESEGFEITYLDVDKYGLIAPEQIEDAIRKNTIIVSIMHANNEIGTIQPIAEISKAIKRAKPDIIFHSDAVQSVSNLKVNVDELGVDLLSFSSQKFYGPKGIGGLYVRKGTRISPVASQKKRRGMESGSLGVPLIVGMAHALELNCKEMDARNAQMSQSVEQVTRGLLTIEAVRINGHPVHKMPGIVNISFLGISGEDAVLRLDKRDIYTSTGSACTSGLVQPSHVLTAMGIPREWALGTLRLSFGRLSTDLDPIRLIKEIGEVVQLQRSTNSWDFSYVKPTEFDSRDVSI